MQEDELDRRAAAVSKGVSDTMKVYTVSDA